MGHLPKIAETRHSKSLIYKTTFSINNTVIPSVKPFKSKNCDIIDLDAPNPNLKKGYDRDFRATA